MNFLHPDTLSRLAADRRSDLQRSAWESRLRRNARHNRRSERRHSPPR